MPTKDLLTTFNFPAGKILNRKYSILHKIGSGWEGEVYLVREISTGIERAAKFFYPHRNPKNKTVVMQAKKLHRLRGCSIVMHYHTQETIVFRRQPICCLVSEYIRGELLSQYVDRQPGKRLNSFQAVHLLHALAKGVEEIHRQGEYHGDLHTDNIILQRFGLGFDLKLIDLFNWNIPKKTVINEELCDMIRVFYDLLGGQKHYAKQPKEIKAICLGLKKSLIIKKFKNASNLRSYLEAMEWE